MVIYNNTKIHQSKQMVVSIWSLRLLLVVISLQQFSSAFIQLPSSTTTTMATSKSPSSQNVQHPHIVMRHSSSSSSPQQQHQDQQPSQSQSQQQQEDPFRATGKKELMTTLKGGLSMIFEMANQQKRDRKMEKEQQQQQQQEDDEEDVDSNNNKLKPTPRWHPHSGIDSDNPDFRTSAPVMNNQGFAKSIWRNVRKRKKPVLWRNALRTYERMTVLEGQADQQYRGIKRMNIHHEGAMLACAKLGLWQKCLEIYHFVDQQDSSRTILPPTASRTKSSNSVSAQSKINRRVYVTDNMVHSLITACTRASNQRASKGKGNHELDEEEAALRRIPLDTALEILTTLEENHDISVSATYVNPLAAAYQSLGYVQQARDILQSMLSNRTAGEEPEDGVDIINVHDLCAKDKGSYSLLVQGAVATGDWGAAVEALGDMTRAGLYPKPRHCNSWSEISERQTRRSWKKKRDDFWMDSVR